MPVMMQFATGISSGITVDTIARIFRRAVRSLWARGPPEAGILSSVTASPGWLRVVVSCMVRTTDSPRQRSPLERAPWSPQVRQRRARGPF